MNKKRIEYDKAAHLLTEANKAIKVKDLQVRQKELKIHELEKFSKQIQGLEDVPQVNVKLEQDIENKVTAETNPVEQEELMDGEILGDDDD